MQIWAPIKLTVHLRLEDIREKKKRFQSRRFVLSPWVNYREITVHFLKKFL